MEQRQAWIVGREVHFDFLISTKHYDIFHHARSRLPSEFGQFETMTVKMDGMNVVAGIAHADSITLSLVQMVSGRHGIAREYCFIDGPLIESMIGCVRLGEGHFNCFIRLGSNPV